jgi:hypothetical protein
MTWSFTKHQITRWNVSYWILPYQLFLQFAAYYQRIKLYESGLICRSGMTNWWLAGSMRPAMSFFAARGKVYRMRMICSYVLLRSKLAELSCSRSEYKLPACNVLISSPHVVLARDWFFNCFIALCLIIAYAILLCKFLFLILTV